MMMRKYEKEAVRKKLMRWLIVMGGVFMTVFLFSISAGASEWYMCNIYPGVAGLLSFVSGLLPFSLYDFSLVVAILLLLGLLFRAVMRKMTWLQFLFSMVRFVSVVVAWFYFAWGIAYFREDFYTRCDVKETVSAPSILHDFAVRFVEEANQSYVHSMMMEKEVVRQQIELGYADLQRELKVNYPNGKRRVKPMMFEPLYAKTGVSGYFGPFFNEVHVNNYSLNFTYPFTLAHEMAHQFGIAKESEANLYAFIVCSKSDDGLVRYSAYLSTILYVLNDVYRFLPDEYEALRSSLRHEIMDDLRRNRAHWLAARDETLSDVQGKVYDAYLKTNKISEGQANYSEVVGLLISSWDIVFE